MDRNTARAASGRWLLVGSLGALATAVFAAENNPGIGVTTHVDKVRVEQSGAIPVIEVSAVGDTYDTVANGNFSMTYEASVTCKDLWDIHYFEVALAGSQSWYDVKGLNFQDKPIGSYTDLLATWGVDSGDKSRAVGNRSLTGPLKPQLRDAAIDKCNLEAQKVADDQGISLPKAMATQRQFALPKSGWVASNLQLQAWTSCGKPQDQITWLSVFDGVPDISVRCKARPYAEGVDTGGMPNQLDANFQVTQLQLTASPTQWSGACPKDLKLTGMISVNKAGTVRYRWRTGNTQSAAKLLEFQAAGSRNVARTIAVEHTWDRTITLLTDGPGKTESNSIDVSFACTTTKGSGDMGVTQPPPTPKPPPARAMSDLVPGDTLTVGNNSAKWGHTLTVNASKSGLGMQGNTCGLQLQYPVRNIGQGNAGAFVSRLGTGAGTLHTGAVQSLGAGASKLVSGTIYLPNGDYDVALAVDALQKVSEANEANNAGTILLKVRNCTPGGPQGNNGNG
jgi:hypothetical protein